MSLLQNSQCSNSFSAGYDIEKSCRFYNGHLSKTFSGAGNRDKWTISVWLKNNGGKTSGSDGLNGIFYSQTDNTHKTAIWNHGWVATYLQIVEYDLRWKYCRRLSRPFGIFTGPCCLVSFSICVG